VTPLMLKADAPLFVRVTTFWPPLPPTVTETQFKLVGLTDALPDDDPPVPVSVTD
jgi:hypothetical protein